MEMSSFSELQASHHSCAGQDHGTVVLTFVIQGQGALNHVGAAFRLGQVFDVDVNASKNVWSPGTWYVA